MWNIFYQVMTRTLHDLLYSTYPLMPDADDDDDDDGNNGDAVVADTEGCTWKRNWMNWFAQITEIYWSGRCYLPFSMLFFMPSWWAWNTLKGQWKRGREHIWDGHVLSSMTFSLHDLLPLCHNRCFFMFNRALVVMVVEQMGTLRAERFFFFGTSVFYGIRFPHHVLNFVAGIRVMKQVREL